MRFQLPLFPSAFYPKYADLKGFAACDASSSLLGLPRNQNFYSYLEHFSGTLFSLSSMKEALLSYAI